MKKNNEALLSIDNDINIFDDFFNFYCQNGSRFGQDGMFLGGRMLTKRRGTGPQHILHSWKVTAVNLFFVRFFFKKKASPPPFSTR